MTNEIGMMRPPVAETARSSPTAQKGQDDKAEAQETGEQQPVEEPPRDQPLDEMVSGLNDLVHELHRELQFSVDEDSGETVIKVIDRETDEVVRQIPPEEVIRLRQRLLEAAGVFIRDSA